LQTSVMDSERVPDAEVREHEGDSEGSSNKYSALRVAEESQNHAPVLCLDRFGVARQMSIAFRGARRKSRFGEDSGQGASATHASGKIL